jgi:hypothetical protein
MTVWNFDEDLGGTFALDVPMDDRLEATEDYESP